MTAFVLREEQFEGYNWNIGDHLIHAGVTDLLRAAGVSDFAYINRKKFSVPAADARADLIAYAGMPQFAAAKTASMDDQAWAMLRHRFPPPTPALNIGCGTGYALHVNRLRVVANMVAERYNQWFYSAQRDVDYLTRDPTSRYFLRAMGLNAELGACPSMLFERSSGGSQAKRPVAIALANPDVKFDHTQSSRLSFAFGNLISELVRTYPDALVICQEPADLDWAASVGVKDHILPTTIDEFMAACGSAKTLISTRVHATVGAFTQGADVLHLAIDGRSDLLTPLMACGLWKVDLFAHSLSDILRFSEQAVYGLGRARAWREPVNQLRRSLLDHIGHTLSAGRSPRSEGGSLTLNPRQCSRVRAGDMIFLTANLFDSHGERPNSDIVVVPLDGRDGIHISGPYIELTAGTYDVDFDLEWWGRLRAPDASLHIDVAAGGRSLASKTIQLRELLTTERLPRLRFSNPNRSDGVEFRISLPGVNTGLQMQFSGVCLTAN